MKKLGIIGGIAPESTIVYYREIVRSFLEHDKEKRYPLIIINSINMNQMLSYIMEDNLPGLVDYLYLELVSLQRAGADFAVLASNTPHIVFNEVNRRSPIPLLSIVELTCKKAKSFGFRKVALFGTKFTMQNKFYQDNFEKENITVITPGIRDQDYIHDIYFNELVKGIFRESTKTQLLHIIQRLKSEESAEAVILGGTELPLLLKENDFPDLPLLDTTKIHIEAILEQLLT